MLRVKDVGRSISFYRDVLGMTNCRKVDFPPNRGDFSLYFLADTALLPSDYKADPDDPEAAALKGLFHPVLELTHNHGTESDDAFQYISGNADKEGESGEQGVVLWRERSLGI